MDSELTPVDRLLMPVEVEVDRLLTLVETETIALPAVSTAEYSWLPLIASVLLAVTWPAATLVNCRSAPGAPTLTTLAGVAPAKPPKVIVPTVAEATPTAAAVVEPAPSATSPALLALAPLPAAKLLVATDSAFGPMATLSLPVATLSGSVELARKYLMPAPPVMLSSA